MVLRQCKFFADENIPPRIIQHLREENFDIISVISEDLVGHSDEDIAIQALTNDRVIITQDQDFGRLFHTTKTQFVGIVYLRPGHIDPGFHISTINKMVEINPSLEPPFIIIGVNTNSSIRIRIRNKAI